MASAGSILQPAKQSAVARARRQMDSLPPISRPEPNPLEALAAERHQAAALMSCRWPCGRCASASRPAQGLLSGSAHSGPAHGQPGARGAGRRGTGRQPFLLWAPQHPPGEPPPPTLVGLQMLLRLTSCRGVWGVVGRSSPAVPGQRSVEEGRGEGRPRGSGICVDCRGGLTAHLCRPRVVPLLLPSARSRAATLECERICFFALNSG